MSDRAAADGGRRTDRLRTELDAVGSDLPPERRDRVADPFGRAVALEAAFFDAAYA